MTVNKVILVGNLGADPETRTTKSGTVVSNLRLATSERQKDRDGNWADHTEWHRVTVFGKTAENVAKFCRKGKQLYIEGKIRTRKWQDQEGRDRYSTEVIADSVRFLGGGDGGRRDDDAWRGNPTGQQGGNQQRQPGPYDGGGGRGGGYSKATDYDGRGPQGGGQYGGGGDSGTPDDDIPF